MPRRTAKSKQNVSSKHLSFLSQYQNLILGLITVVLSCTVYLYLSSMYPSSKWFQPKRIETLPTTVTSRTNQNQIRQSINNLMNIAKQQWDEREFEKAAKTSDYLLETIPEHEIKGTDWNNIGITFWDAKQLDKAFAAFVKAYLKAPDSDIELKRSALEHISGVWGENIENVSFGDIGVEKELKIIVKEAVDFEKYKLNPKVKEFLAKIMFRLSEFESALKTYESLLEEYSPHVDKGHILFGYGLVLFFMGQTEASINKFEQAYKGLIVKMGKSWLGDTSDTDHPFYFLSVVDPNRPNEFSSKLFYPCENVTFQVKSPAISSVLDKSSVSYYPSRSSYILTFENLQSEDSAIYHTKSKTFFISDRALFYSLESKLSKNYIDVHVDEGIFTLTWKTNYYHWTCEALSRILLLKETGFFTDHPKAKLLLPIVGATVMNATLDYIGIPEENRFYYREDDRLSIDTFYFPHTPNFIYQQHMSNQLPSPHSIQLTNRFFNPHPLPLALRKKIVYLSRRTVSNRRTTFDDILIPKLQQIFGKNLVIHSNTKFADQVKLFKEARLVFGPHGAGFANCIFVAPHKTAMIEFPTTARLTDYYFSNIAAALDLYYWKTPGLWAGYYNSFQNSTESVDIIIKAVTDVANFMKTLE